MARRLDHSGFRTRNARLRLSVSKVPYLSLTLARGVSLLYRRNKKNGTWIVRALAADGKSYWTKGFAEADDHTEADGDKVLTFYQAQDRAKELARGSDTEVAPAAAPITVDRALTAYEADLRARDADIYNARQPRKHLPASLLAKPVPLLTSGELKHWRDALLTKKTLAPATINRICNSLCAALELAAQHDTRIANRSAWEIGLAGLPNAQTARNVVLDDAKVRELIAAAYAHDSALGLLVDVLAVSGQRPSQVVRLHVEDLHLGEPSDDAGKLVYRAAKLMMPKSAKGGGRNRAEKRLQSYSVPITTGLADKLKAAAQGRTPDEPLLLRAGGQPWNPDPALDYRRPVREIIKSIGLDADKVTLYSLRHSSIVRMLLKNIPARLVASLHNTSISQLERNYSAHIAEYADEHARAALLEDSAAPSELENVVPMRRAT